GVPDDLGVAAELAPAPGLQEEARRRLGLGADASPPLSPPASPPVAAAGCGVFVVHARNAVLKGLSPKENREIPPLRYDVVHRLKADFPALAFVTNGGLADWTAVERELASVDGVMLGRTAYHDPWFLAAVDWKVYGDDAPPRARADVLRALVPYAERELARGTPLRAIARHVLGLYHGQSGGRRFRQILSDSRLLATAGPQLLLEALAAVEPQASAA
ncbi:MAG: tRNA-dihydrouridine synthase, partial [Burkholderiales bacterium]|nr:tRNA-dihydrouridine synthase [Burkholderiales bacterium]